MTDDQADRDRQMAYALGQIAESNRHIANAVEGIQENLATLNDRNVLHQAKLDAAVEKTQTNIDGLKQLIMKLIDKWFWLIVLLIVALLVSLGLKETFTLLPKVVAGWFGG